MTDQPSRGPGVRFPPPLMFLLGLAAGWAIPFALFDWPLLSAARAHWRWIPVAAFGLAALWLLVSALGGFRRKGNDPRPWREDSALVVEGIYRHTRNPMYLGMALLYVAGAVAMNSVWPLLTLGPVLFVVQHHVIAREERYLADLFGEAYLDYCKAVRRWF